MTDVKCPHNIFVAYEVCSEEQFSTIFSSLIRINIDKIPARTEFGTIFGTLLVSLQDKDIEKILSFFLEAEKHYGVRVKNRNKEEIYEEVYVMGTTLRIPALLILRDESKEG